MKKGKFLELIKDVPDDFNLFILDKGSYSDISYIINYTNKTIELTKYKGK